MYETSYNRESIQNTMLFSVNWTKANDKVLPKHITNHQHTENLFTKMKA